MHLHVSLQKYLCGKKMTTFCTSVTRIIGFHGLRQLSFLAICYITLQTTLHLFIVTSHVQFPAALELECFLANFTPEELLGLSQLC